jgi:hypothetical protein
MRDPFYNVIGVLTVTDKYTPDKVTHVQRRVGTGGVVRGTAAHAPVSTV